MSVFTEEGRAELSQLAESMSDEARELKAYADNDGDLYRRQTTSMIKNLMTKKGQGRYDTHKAAKLAMYLMDAAAKKYTKDHGSSDAKWNEIFSKKDRMQAAQDWVSDFEAEAELGNYDDYLPKKYRKK